MSGADTPLLELEGLEVHFGGGGRAVGPRRRVVRAVDGIDLTVRRGETLGVVGESGSGKSTLGRAIVGVHANTGGTLRFEGEPVSTKDPGLTVSATAVSDWRRSVQMVFQDPFDALNPRMRVRDCILEPLVARRWGEIAEIDVDGATPLSQLRKEHRRAVVQVLTEYRLPWTGDEGYKKAEVTGGGVALSEIDSRTMESRRASGLFLCGEILDAFGPIGGHNFLWAWATGRAAGRGV